MRVLDCEILAKIKEGDVTKRAGHAVAFHTVKCA